MVEMEKAAIARQGSHHTLLGVWLFWLRDSFAKATNLQP